MFEKIKSWFLKGLWSEVQVLNAVKNPVKKPFLTQAEAEEIISGGKGNGEI